MLSRFRDGLIYPENIIKYRKDSIFLVLLIMIIYASIMSLNIIIDTVTYDGMDVYTEELLEESIVEENINCEISDSVLLCEEDTDHLLIEYYGIVDVYLNNDYQVNDEYSGANVIMVIYDDEVFITTGGFSSFSLKISDLPEEFHNMSFKEIEDNDLFFESLVDGIDNYMISHLALWGTMIIIIFIGLNFLLALFVALLTGYFIKNRFKIIPYKETFRFGVYVSGSTFIMLGLMNMLGGDFLFIFVIVVINFRQMSRLTMSINNVIKK